MNINYTFYIYIPICTPSRQLSNFCLRGWHCLWFPNTILLLVPCLNFEANITTIKNGIDSKKEPARINISTCQCFSPFYHWMAIYCKAIRLKQTLLANGQAVELSYVMQCVMLLNACHIFTNQMNFRIQDPRKIQLCICKFIRYYM